MISVDGQRYVEIRGFEIRGHTTDQTGHNPVGILVTGASDHVSIVGNVVHDMGTTFRGRIGGDAHGIAVYGNLADHPIDEVVIRGNELFNLTLGSSEALVVNGNVTGWLIQDNVVHDTNNIGIVAIGYEGTAPDPGPSGGTSSTTSTATAIPRTERTGARTGSMSTAVETFWSRATSYTT